MKKVLFNWSGGKDASLSLYRLLASHEYEVSHLITSIDKQRGRITLHEVRDKLLELQARRLGLPLHKILLPARYSVTEYGRIMRETLYKFKSEIYYAAFGDIFLEDLREFREERLKQAGIKALFPLWKQSTTTLANEFIDLGFKAVVVCVDGNKLDPSFIGREFDYLFLKDLPGHVDPCGEYGEFHTFVYDGPIFSEAVPLKRGEIIRRSYNVGDYHSGRHPNGLNSRLVEPGSSFWFLDLLTDDLTE